MTEQEWLQTSDLDAMLKHLDCGVTERKFRLTECAFLRRFWHLLSDKRSQWAVEIAEQYADGLATKMELDHAYAEANAAFEVILKVHFPDRRPERSYWGGAVSAAQHAAGSSYDAWELLGLQAAKDSPKRFGYMPRLIWHCTAAHPIERDVSLADGDIVIAAEQASEVLVLRDIFGNPFRPVTLTDLSLRLTTENILPLAQAIYNDRAFAQMLELSDALKQAGCTNFEVLNHCRSGGPHVQGCWAVDLILGKK